MESENVLIDNSQETLETWAYIEIMGHNRIAGRVSERKIGVSVILQVDVPKPDKEGFSHTELYSPSSIFSIKPTTEEWCRKFIKTRVDYPVLPYVITAKQLPPGSQEEQDYFDELSNQ